MLKQYNKIAIIDVKLLTNKTNTWKAQQIPINLNFTPKRIILKCNYFFVDSGKSYNPSTADPLGPDEFDMAYINDITSKSFNLYRNGNFEDVYLYRIIAIE